MTAAIAILAAIALAALVVSRRKRKDDPAQTPRGWLIRWSPGMPERPVAQGAGWYFDFPTDPQSHVHYVQNFTPPPIVPGATLVARFRVEGTGRFVPQEFPDRPATVSLLIQRRGDNWGAQGEFASYRWYSAQTVELREGEFTIEARLTADNWGDVYGAHDPLLFEKALADVENIGLVFGSAGGRGHGVYATSSSRFVLQMLH